MGRGIVGLAASLSSHSKTLGLVRTVAQAVGERTGEPTRVINLIEIAAGLSVASTRDQLSADLKDALQAVETADLLVVGSPVYKGSYSGLFKSFFDLVDYTALQGHPVALTATGGSDRHALVIEHQLRPLFGFFGAHTLPTGFYASDRDFADGVIVDAAQKARLEQLVREATDVLARRPAHA